MDRNYNIYRPDIAETLMEVDNIIEKTEHEIKELKERKNAKLDDPERVKGINEGIQEKEAELARFEQNRNDILGDYQ